MGFEKMDRAEDVLESLSAQQIAKDEKALAEKIEADAQKIAEDLGLDLNNVDNNVVEMAPKKFASETELDFDQAA